MSSVNEKMAQSFKEMQSQIQKIKMEVEKEHLKLSHSITTLKKEQDQEFSDLREENRFKINSMIQCLNTVSDRNMSLTDDLK